MTFIPQHLTEETIRDIQFKGLKWTVAHAYTNSPVYRKTGVAYWMIVITVFIGGLLFIQYKRSKGNSNPMQ